ncbi:hypothetical protein NLI96_g4230 [Meripilus lineatus]|uniref:BTB domain-containing protein n=1 Tax=Meripilus lineatus TaxID=2056292 RepID=A0AAD5YI88_9APHY|nr:hypothetical protein NLI96_g4230 [Physisporinus lineatus]
MRSISDSTLSSRPLQIAGLLPSFPESLNRECYLKAAYKASLSEGTFFDTKFYVFSRRRSSGSVDTPKAVFANSAILRASSQYFISLLVGGFAEDTHSDLSAGFPSGKAISNAEYEYDEDSDLDDEIEIEGDSADANAKDSSTDSGVALLDQVEHEESPAASETSQQRREPKRQPTVSNAQLGRVIVIPDVAYTTYISSASIVMQCILIFSYTGRWQALVYYLGTGEISFSSLRSETHSLNALLPEDLSKGWGAPPCSPKSMYRLAHQLQLTDLKKLAFEDIESKLSAQNIFNELFSSFTARWVSTDALDPRH